MPTCECFCQDCEDKVEISDSIRERKRRGERVKCPKCVSTKTVQIFENFFTISKGGSSFGSGCGPNPTPGFRG